MKDRSLPARVVGTHSLFLSANTQKDAASGGYVVDAEADLTPRPGPCCGGTSPPLVEQNCIRRVSDDAAADSHAEFAAGGGVLRLWSRVASGGYHADAVADRMLSLQLENEPSACRPEFGACMRTGVSEDNSRKSSGHLSRYCKALTLRSSAIWILVYFCHLNSSLKICGGGDGEAAQESQVSSLRVDWQNQTTRKTQVRSHSGADLTPKLLRYRTKEQEQDECRQVLWPGAGRLAKQQVCIEVGHRQHFQGGRPLDSRGCAQGGAGRWTSTSVGKIWLP